jgi:glycosyltransferase involved in cell wall biosynthesis
VAPDEAPPAQGIRVKDRDEDGLRVIRVAHPDLGDYRLSYPGRLLALRKAFGRVLDSGFEPDLIHARVFYAGFAALLLARPRDLPVIVSEHYTAFPRGRVTGFGKWMAQTTFRRAALVCPDAHDLQHHIEALGIRARFRVMPNIIDSETFHPSAEPRSRERDTPLILLNVASLDPKKGQQDLLEALATVRAGGIDARLRVIGDGGLRGTLERAAAELGIEKAVTFLGGRPKQEVAEEMRRADALALPSHFENAPLAVSEALASGLPVIGTTVGDVAEMLGSHDGVAVAPGDPPALAQAIRAFAAELPTPDVERARNRWGHGPAGRLWAEVYEEEIARRRARRSSAP